MQVCLDASFSCFSATQNKRLHEVPPSCRRCALRLRQCGACVEWVDAISEENHYFERRCGCHRNRGGGARRHDAGRLLSLVLWDVAENNHRSFV